MKPVGVERDKQIAELRGYLNSKTSFEFTEEIHLQCDGENWHKKNWSTSWNDAKELLIDFGNEDFVCIIRFVRNESDGSYTVGIKIFKAIKEDTIYPIGRGQLFGYGKTIDEAMADAVSQAWIKWRERE